MTVTGGELVVTLTGGTNPNRHTVVDAVRLAEDALVDLASEWSDSKADDRLIWGEWLLVDAWRFNCRQLNLTTGSS